MSAPQHGLLEALTLAQASAQAGRRPGLGGSHDDVTRLLVRLGSVLAAGLGVGLLLWALGRMVRR